MYPDAVIPELFLERLKLLALDFILLLLRLSKSQRLFKFLKPVRRNKHH